MYYDTHAHYDSEAFDADRDELLANMVNEGVGLIINPGCDLVSSRAAIELAHRYDHVYAAVGWHPEEVNKLTQEAFAAMLELASDPKCVAIGEIGLDYYWDDTHKDEQKELFCRQLDHAVQHALPVIIHDRDSHADCMDIVRGYDDLRGVFHCYSGSAEMAKELLRRGWYLGFDGPVTYKNARKALEVLEICPVERILIETDSPYMSPVPMRGKRNDSRNLRYVTETIARIKNTSPEEIERITAENARTLFKVE